MQKVKRQRQVNLNLVVITIIIMMMMEEDLIHTALFKHPKHFAEEVYRENVK